MTEHVTGDPLVSLVIPSYNEEADILSCVQSVLALGYAMKEIIVVDESTDRTPELLRPYAERGAIRLLRPEKRLNVSTARNRGIRAAKGEIIVLLNADVVLDHDFVQRILHHYRQGADFVVCESQVANTERLIPAFMQAVHEFEHGSRDDLTWSEGWSCRRSVFERAGFFDESFPAAGGEDAAFGFWLLQAGFRRIQDHSIVVRHITPHSLMGFIRQMVGRGRGEYYFTVLFLRKDPRPAIALAMLPWAVVLMLCGSMFFYPVGTMVGGAGLVIAAGRALRSGLRLSRLGQKPSKVLLFAALNFLRFRCKEYGYLSAYWAGRVGNKHAPGRHGTLGMGRP